MRGSGLRLQAIDAPERFWVKHIILYLHVLGGLLGREQSGDLARMGSCWAGRWEP